MNIRGLNLSPKFQSFFAVLLCLDFFALALRIRHYATKLGKFKSSSKIAGETWQKKSRNLETPPPTSGGRCNFEASSEDVCKIKVKNPIRVHMDGRNQMTTSFWLLVLAVVGCYTCCLFLCIVVSKMPHVVAIRIFRAPCACVWCCCYPVCARYINIKVSILHRLSVVTRFVQQGGSD